MKTALEYTIDLERDLNLMDGLDDRAHKMPHTHDGEAYITITGSMIIERHVKKIIEDATAAEADRCRSADEFNYYEKLEIAGHEPRNYTLKTQAIHLEL
jgi:hypothetical protein